MVKLNKINTLYILDNYKKLLSDIVNIKERLFKNMKLHNTYNQQLCNLTCKRLKCCCKELYFSFDSLWYFLYVIFSSLSLFSQFVFVCWCSTFSVFKLFSNLCLYSEITKKRRVNILIYTVLLCYLEAVLIDSLHVVDNFRKIFWFHLIVKGYYCNMLLSQ